MNNNEEMNQMLKKIDFISAEKVLRKKDMPLYSNLELQIKIFEMAMRQNGYKRKK